MGREFYEPLTIEVLKETLEWAKSKNIYLSVLVDAIVELLRECEAKGVRLEPKVRKGLAGRRHIKEELEKVLRTCLQG